MRYRVYSNPQDQSGTPKKIRKRKRKSKNFEFSKIMALIAIAMWLIVNFFGMIIVILTLDTSPLMYVIPSVDAVVAAIIAFYLWKARAENTIKLKRIYGVDLECLCNDESCGVVDANSYTPAVTGDDAPLYENSNIV